MAFIVISPIDILLAGALGLVGSVSIVALAVAGLPVFGALLHMWERSLHAAPKNTAAKS